FFFCAPRPPPPPLFPYTTLFRSLALWFAAFGAEVGDKHERPAAIIDERLSYGGFTLWEDGGRPVSLAGLTRRVAGQVRVGPVYTDRKSTRLNSSHRTISYAVFCL